MEKQPKKHVRNLREEAIAFRKECIEKGISLKDAMLGKLKEKRERK